MKNSPLDFRYDNALIRFHFLPPLLIFIAAVAFSCSERKGIDGGFGLMENNSFNNKTIKIHFNEWQGEYVRYKNFAADGLLAWTVPDRRLKLLSGNGELLDEINLNSIVSFTVYDVCKNGEELFFAGLNSEAAILNLSDHGIRALDINKAKCKSDYRVYATKKFPIFMEDSFLYFINTDPRYNDYFTDFSAQRKFFSTPLEMRYDLKTGKTKCFGSYPALYREKVMEFYRWPAHRQRMNDQSIYSFAHVDSLFVFSDRTSQEQTVSRKSVLRNRDLIPLDKSRLMDYSYLWDYDFINDRYTELIADPYRNLIYSVFRPGVDPPEQRRLTDRDVAFTVMVYDADLEFQKEVFFPPGRYDPGVHFVTPEGLCLQTVASEGNATRVFDVFDFTREGRPMEVVPENLSLTHRMVPLAEYLRDSLGVAESVDSVVVISGLGCSGCLESMIVEAEAKGVDLDRYAYIATREAARIQTISDFLTRHSLTYVDSIGDLGDYRAIGDFLTLVTLSGDSLVAVDEKFEF